MRCVFTKLKNVHVWLEQMRIKESYSFAQTFFCINYECDKNCGGRSIMIIIFIEFSDILCHKAREV